jgi:hypothetical protein
VTSIDAVPALQEALATPDLDPEVADVLLSALVSIGQADAGLALVQYLEQQPSLDDRQVEQLSALLAGGQFPEETRKVFREAVFEDGIGDERLINLLARLATEESAGEDGPEEDTDRTDADSDASK